MSESEVDFFISDIDALPQGIMFLTFMAHEFQKHKELLFLVPLFFSLVVGLTADNPFSPSLPPAYAVDNRQFFDSNLLNNPEIHEHVVGSQPGDIKPPENLPHIGRR